MQMLVAQSYENGNLDQERVAKISSMLNRRQLKEYIKALMREEKKRSVEILSSHDLSKKDKYTIAKLFPKKKIIYTYDPSLLAGLQIRYNDNIYELSLRKRFDDIIHHIAQDL